MLKQIVPFIFYGLWTVGCIIVWEHFEYQITHRRLEILELYAGLNFMLVGLVRRSIKRRQPIPAGKLKLFFYSVLAVLSVTYVAAHLLFFLEMTDSNFKYWKSGLVWIYYGRLVMMMPIYYLYNWFWEDGWTACGSAGQDPPSTTLELVTDEPACEAHPKSVELGQAYLGMIGMAPPEVEEAVAAHQKKFRKVAVLPFEKKIIEKKFTRTILFDLPEVACVSCLQGCRAGEQAVVIGCSHLFHLRCLRTWTRLGMSCQLCNKNFREELLRAMAYLPN